MSNHDAIIDKIEEIREWQEEQDDNRNTLEKLKDEIEGLEDDIKSLDNQLSEARVELEDMIDEATNARSVPAEPSYMGALRRL